MAKIVLVSIICSNHNSSQEKLFSLANSWGKTTSCTNGFAFLCTDALSWLKVEYKIGVMLIGLSFLAQLPLFFNDHYSLFFLYRKPITLSTISIQISRWKNPNSHLPMKSCYNLWIKCNSRDSRSSIRHFTPRNTKSNCSMVVEWSFNTQRKHYGR